MFDTAPNNFYCCCVDHTFVSCYHAVKIRKKKLGDRWNYVTETDKHLELDMCYGVF